MCDKSDIYCFCGLYEKGHVVSLLLLADLACLFMLRVQLGNFTFLQDSLRQSSLERHTSFARKSFPLAITTITSTAVTTIQSHLLSCVFPESYAGSDGNWLSSRCSEAHSRSSTSTLWRSSPQFSSLHRESVVFNHDNHPLRPHYLSEVSCSIAIIDTINHPQVHWVCNSKQE